MCLAQKTDKRILQLLKSIILWAFQETRHVFVALFEAKWSDERENRKKEKEEKKRNKKENGRGKKRKSKKPPPAEHAASSVLAGSVPRTIMVCSAQVPLYSPFKCVCNRYNIINLIIATVFIYFSFLSNAMKLNYLLVIHIFAIFISNLDHLYLQLFYLLFWNHKI